MKVDRNWIVKNSVEITEQYDKGVLTLRGLHYRLVAAGMDNDFNHYKKVVNAMISARRDGTIDYDVFSDHEREMVGDTEYKPINLQDEIETGKEQVFLWMKSYRRNRWENQEYVPYVLVEKKALLGTFEPICKKKVVAYGACKGYPSLTFLYNLSLTLKEVLLNGQRPVILYFGDYDPSGEDIPRSIEENLTKDFGLRHFKIERILLNEKQVLELNLPPAPVKSGDSRSKKWNGLGQVELDAVEPHLIQSYIQTAINDYFDVTTYNRLVNVQNEEKKQYIKALKEYVNNL